MGRLAIIAGDGNLPHQIAAVHPDALYVTVTGEAPEGVDSIPARYEKFGALFRALRRAGVTEAVLAGSAIRPAINPLRFDAKTMTLAPKFLAALKQGDDGLLRAVIAAFEAEGFRVRGAHELLPDLTAKPGLLAGPAPSAGTRADIARANLILQTLGPLDLGQGCIVARGICLGIETVQGTNAMLRGAAEAPEHLRRGGVLVKAPKPGQDLRVDMPAIGPDTVDLVAGAGLGGIAIAAGGVLIVERAATLAAAEAARLFILAQEV